MDTTLNITDYLLFALIFTISSSVGLYYGWYKKQITPSSYFFGDKKMLLLPIAISLVASNLAAYTFIGLPAEVYKHGTQVVMLAPALLIVGILNHYIYLPVFYKLQLNSVYEYLELRFDRSIRNITSLICVIRGVLFLPVLMYAPALALNIVTGFNVHAIVWIMACVCVFYTAVGGLRAVVWTDALEFLITFLALLYAVIKGISLVGGPKEMWQKAFEGDRLEFFNIDPDPTIRTTFWSVLVGNIIVWTENISLNPALLQRSISLPSYNKAQKANAINVTMTALTKVFSCLLGLIVFARYAQCDPLSIGAIKRLDQILPYFVSDVTQEIPGVRGLFIAGFLTATFGVLSTGLNTIAGVIYFDFMIRILPENVSVNRTNVIIKIMAVVMGLTGAALVLVIEKLGSIFELFHCIQGIMSGTTLGIFTLGLTFPRANKKGALAGIASSLVIMSYIVIQQQIYLQNGVMKFESKPLRSDGCNTTFLNETFIATSMSPNYTPFWLVRISFQYFCLIGALITIVIGVLASLFLKEGSRLNVDPNLLTPCVRRITATAQNECADKEVFYLFPKRITEI